MSLRLTKFRHWIFPPVTCGDSISEQWVHERISCGSHLDHDWMGSLYETDRPGFRAINKELSRRKTLAKEFVRINENRNVTITREEAIRLINHMIEVGFEPGVTRNMRENFSKSLIESILTGRPTNRLLDDIQLLNLQHSVGFTGYLYQALPTTYQQLQLGANNPNQDNNEDNIMTTANNEEKSNFGTAVAEAAKMGAKMAIAAEATHVITEVSKAALVKAGVPALMLEESALVNKGVPLVSSILILWLSENYPDMVPKSAMVSEAAKLALSQATQETLKPLLKQAAPALMALATSGEKLAKLHEGDRKEDDDEEEFEVDFTITQEDVA